MVIHTAKQIVEDKQQYVKLAVRYYVRSKCSIDERRSLNLAMSLNAFFFWALTASFIISYRLPVYVERFIKLAVQTELRDEVW